MKGYLELWLETDGDGTCELFAKFSSGEFAGQGSAWFGLKQLEEKAELFGQYPLPVEHPVTIEGGFWSREKSGALSEEHLHIAAIPINARGGLALRVRVAAPRRNAEDPQSAFFAAGEIRTTYEDIARFSKELAALVRGERRDLRLEENEL